MKKLFAVMLGVALAAITMAVVAEGRADIINSPFATFGYEVENEIDREKFFRKLNF